MMTNDERKVRFRKGLSTLYLPIYDFLCQELPPEWAPFQGIRTVDEQDQIYMLGRTRPGKIVTNAKGGQSPHNYGCATDWTIFLAGQPQWMGDKDLRWLAYSQAIEKVGARWGGDWSGTHGSNRTDFDKPHNELKIDCSWVHVYLEFAKNGMTAAQQYIEERVAKKPDSGQTSK